MANIVSAIVAFGISSVLGIVLIPYLRKLKFGQTILDIGPSWHKNKQGTPTMGGIMFIIGVTCAIGVAFAFDKSTHDMMFITRLFGGLVMALAFGALGFVDDFIKVVKKRNLGLTSKQKLVFQFLIATAYIATLYLAGDTSTRVIIPFIGQLDLWWFYYPIMIIAIVLFVNAVNLTDGVDGLASSVTFMAALGMLIISGLLSATGMEIFSSAVAGGCLGFLIWNFHPAKVFMGDTGSMFLGGCVVAICFGVGIPVLLILVGLIYLVEALSVIIQVISFKTTGKRVFKMSPIHHHYEMSGWSEEKIVIVFSLVTLASSAVAVLGIINL